MSAPSCGRSSSVPRKARTSTTNESAPRPTASGAGSTAVSPPTSTAPGRFAVCIAPSMTSTISSSPSRRCRLARSSCACSPTTFPSRSSMSTRIASTRLSTTRSCDWSAWSATKSSASQRRKCSVPKPSSSRSRSSTARRAAKTWCTNAMPRMSMGARAGCATRSSRTCTSMRRSRATTSSVTTSPTSRWHRKPWPPANRSCAQSWMACRRRWPTSIATSAASTSTARSCSISA